MNLDILSYFDLLTRPKMPFHGDAPEGGVNLLSFLLRCGTRPYERGTQ